jgi:hypothetical protein
LSNSQVLGASSAAAGTPSNLSSSTLSNLNAAFTKLIGDLGGTTSGAPTTSSGASTTSSGAAAATAAATGSTGTDTSPAGSPPADTTALQSFLTTFLQDLQSGAGSSASTLGNSVNIAA